MVQFYNVRVFIDIDVDDFWVSASSQIVATCKMCKVDGISNILAKSIDSKQKFVVAVFFNLVLCAC